MILVALIFSSTTTATAQETLPKPGPELDVLKADVGTWDVEIKSWTGPGAPTISKGKETNRMLGGFWLLVEFQGNMMGLDFQGHGTYGYDAKKKQYVGTWVDSMSPLKMEMVGSYDKNTKTLVYEGMAPGLDGNPAKHLLTTKYNNDGTRELSMHIQDGEENVKLFEMKYTKSTAAVKGS